MFGNKQPSYAASSTTDSSKTKEPDPVRVASADDPDLISARRRKLQEAMTNRAGRTSTDLTGGSSASTTYSKSTLG